MVKTYTPDLVLTGGDFRRERLGSSLVVAPGGLGDGKYALVDLADGEAEQKTWR
jgi:hypothetical protein